MHVGYEQQMHALTMEHKLQASSMHACASLWSTCGSNFKLLVGHLGPFCAMQMGK
jgi:hypothetical protein